MGRYWTARILSIIAVLVLVWIIGNYVDNYMLKGAAASWRRVIYLCSFYSILAVSLNLINGITGQFSIGHAAFYQVGAYSAAYMSSRVLTESGLPGPLLLLLVTCIGAVFAGLAGWAVGLPSLRLKGDYLAIATLGFGEIVRIIVLNQKWLGGSYGMTGIPGLTQLSYVLLLVVITVAVSRNLCKTGHGLAFLAIREDEVAADAMGVNTTRFKVWAFVIGAALAGAAGSVYGHYEEFLSPDSFKMDVSFIVLTMVVVGGSGSITGSLIAAVTLIALQERLAYISPIPAGQLYGVAVFMLVGALITSGGCRRLRPGRAATFAAWGGTVVAAVILGVVAGKLLSDVSILAPALTKMYRPSDLRMVLFALSLIIIMLARPQGLLGRSEFSLAALGRMLGLGKSTSEARS
ncbi:MAG: branched-chain amino acid ABC transporter permease [Fimbriimonadia bacterium]|jgi:branched-chain amino acid transport system permease protein